MSIVFMIINKLVVNDIPYFFFVLISHDFKQNSAYYSLFSKLVN